MIAAARRTPGPADRAPSSRGAVLVEFAVVALALYLLLAALLTFGSMLWIGQGLQQAVDVAAREAARLPLPADMPLGLGVLERRHDLVAPAHAADREEFRREIYDERYLVIRPEELAGRSLLEFADDELPLLNRLLVPLLIFDREHDGGVWRYPGTIVVNGDTGEETVLVPLVQAESGAIEWVAPVEEIRSDHDASPSTPPEGPFSLVEPPGRLPGFVPGVVALRLNYPFQSAAMSSFGRSDAGPFEPNWNRVVSADDTLLSPAPTFTYSVAPGKAPNDYVDGVPQIHAGRYGLGRQFALPFERESIRELGVRPYRRVLTAQAVYRRELYEP